MKGICKYCRKDFSKPEQIRVFCSRFCANNFNQNRLKAVTLPGKSKNLAEFVGICLGDGCAWGYQVSITLHRLLDSQYIPYVSELSETLFAESKVSLVTREDQAIDIRISSKIVTDFMKRNGVISKRKEVPSWIYSDKSYLKSCIRGLIDTDGSFIWHKYKVKGKLYKYLKLSFTNRSEELLNFIFNGLKKLGLNPKRSYKFQVWLHGQSDVIKYLNIIGTNNFKNNIKKLKMRVKTRIDRKDIIRYI